MSQESIIVRKSLKWRSIFLVLLISVITPVALFESYYYLREINDISFIESELEHKDPFALNDQLKSFYQQYGSGKESINLQIKIWNKPTVKEVSYDEKVQKLIVSTIFLENFWLVPEQFKFFTGKFYYELGTDYYPESMIFLENYLNILNQASSLTGQEVDFDERDLARDNSNIDESEKMLYEIHLALGQNQKALKFATRLFHRYKNTNQRIDWQIKLAKAELALNHKNLAMNYLEDVLINLRDASQIKTIGFMLIDTATELRLQHKVVFYSDFLLEKKVVTKKTLAQHIDKLKQISKNSRNIL